MAGIIVGVNGSPGAHRALDWAMKEAAAHHAHLTVVAVHEVPMNGWTGNADILGADVPELEKTRRAAEEAVSKAAAQLGESQPASVTLHAANGFPAEELINASRDADLLVVGFAGGRRVHPADDGLDQQTRSCTTHTARSSSSQISGRASGLCLQVGQARRPRPARIPQLPCRRPIRPWCSSPATGRTS